MKMKNGLVTLALGAALAGAGCKGGSQPEMKNKIVDCKEKADACFGRG